MARIVLIIAAMMMTMIGTIPSDPGASDRCPPPYKVDNPVHGTRQGILREAPIGVRAPPSAGQDLLRLRGGGPTPRLGDPAFVNDEEHDLFRFTDSRFAFSREKADWKPLTKRGGLSEELYESVTRGCAER